MDPALSREYRTLYENHWWFRAREELIVHTLRRLRPSGRYGEILDIGCGDGLLFSRLQEFGNVDGVEPAAEFVSPGNLFRPRIHIGPFDETFQTEKKYNLILMLDVLEHLADPVQALRHAVALLDREGVIFITLPAFNALWTSHDALNHHVTRYRRETFRPLARLADLQITEERYWFQWVFPVKLAVAAVEKLLPLTPAPASVPPRPINRALYWLTRAEHATLGRLGLPFGSSLFVVCQKKGSLG